MFHFLPPYCPSANRIERVWWDVHAEVRMGEGDAYLEGRNAQSTSRPTLRGGSMVLAA